MDKNGFTIKELLFAFTLIAGIIFLLQPVFRDLSDKKQQVNCLDNMRNIGEALYIYAKENNKNFPKTIRILYEEQYISDEELLDCPASPAKGTLEEPDYIYAEGLSLKNDSNLWILFDREGNHPGGKNTLLVNGDLLWQENNK